MQEGPPTLELLAPDHVGLTVQEQPSLFWYLSAPSAKACVFTLSRPGVAKPVLRAELDAHPAGIRRLDLADYHVKLDPGVEYRAQLVLVWDPARRADDLATSAAIKRVEASDDLVADLQRRSRPFDRAVLLARRGVWYDALATVSDQVDQDPDDRDVRLQRARLLKQVSLDDPAAFDEALAQSR